MALRLLTCAASAFRRSNRTYSGSSMAEITASMVRELREKTDAPMMECKKALAEAAGDMGKAEEILRVKLGNKASRPPSHRRRRRGRHRHLGRRQARLVIEVNCETDFVARTTTSGWQNRAGPSPPRAGPTSLPCRRCRWARAPSSRSAPRWSARSARTCRSAVCPHRGGKLFSTSTAVPRSACCWTWSAATSSSARHRDAHRRVQAEGARRLGRVADLIDAERRIAIEKAAPIRQAGSDHGKIADGTVQKFLKEVTLLARSS